MRTIAPDLQRLYKTLRDQKRKAWDRDLPFDELLFDRSERARSLGFGAGTTIYQNSYLFGPVRVGKNTWIGPYTLLDGSGGLRIGNFCSISTGVLIYSHDSVQWALTAGKAGYDKSPVVIEDCCYIGSHSIINRGVTVGHHSVVAAGSFVNRSVPPYSIVAGTPAKPIGRVRIDRKGRATLIYSQKRGKR